MAKLTEQFQHFMEGLKESVWGDLWGKAQKAGHEPLHGLQAIPKDDQRASRMPQQRGEELDHLSGANRASVRAEVALAPQDDGGDGRQLRPVEAMAESPRSAARRPRS